MPLPPPAPRHSIHDRHVHCAGFRRDDGLWDIEGHLRDTKTYAFENRERGTIKAGTPIHKMWMRLTIDDDLNIHAVETHTDSCHAHASDSQVVKTIYPKFYTGT